MNHRTALLAIGLSLVSLPGMCQSFVSNETASNNPMNGVGVAHNAYAGCMAANYDPRSGVAPMQLLVERCGFPTKGPADEFIREHTQVLNASNGDPRLSFAENLAPYRKAFSEEQFSYFEDMDQILAVAASPEEADRLLKTLENQAIKDLGRKDADLAVLGGISTARHSLELWTQDKAGPNGTTGRFPWMAVIVADASGFVSGYNTCGKICGIVVGGIKSLVAAFD